MSTNILTEFVTAEEDFANFMSYMPNPDYILGSTGSTLEVIERMLCDPHVTAKLEELKNEILSRAWSLTPVDNSPSSDKICTTITEILTGNLDLENDLEELLTALEYGFSISEVIWKEEKGEWIPDSIKGRSQKRFRFKKDGTPMIQKNSMWVDLDPERYEKKFIIFNPFSINENPYGSSILLKCYWSWKFKTAGFKFWLTMLDRFGVPGVLALFKTDEQDAEKIKERAEIIAGELAKLDSNSSAALANVEKATTLQNKGASGDFQIFIEICNAEISKGITGSILTSDTGTHGSYGQSKSHENTKEKKGKRIARKLARKISATLITWITELNWSPETLPPKFCFDIEDIPGFETIEKAITLGIPISKRALYSTYNLPEPENEEDIFVKETGTEQTFADITADIRKGDPYFFLQTRKRYRKRRQPGLKNWTHFLSRPLNREAGL